MTADYTKLILSGSTDGLGIKVAAVATPGTLIHTAQASNVDGDYDEIWMYAVSAHTGVVELTLEWGGVTDPDDLIQLAIQPKSGLYLITPGILLHNSLVVRAFADVADVILIHGFVNRITI